MKRLSYSLLLLLLLVLCMSGCAVPQHYDVRRDLSITFGNSDRVIEELRRAFSARSQKITVCYESASDNMDDICPLTEDLVMFAMSETDDPREGDWLYHQYGGYRTEYSYVMDGGRYCYTIGIIPEYFTTPAQDETVEKKIAEIIAGLDLAGKSGYEKIKAVYNYVVSNVKYDRVHMKNTRYHLKSTAYGALVNGCACCQGFSVLMYRLLREAGINARVITGNAVREGGNEYHAWNIAEIDGVYYNIDATWDAMSGETGYFLKGESGFSGTHIRDGCYLTEEFNEKYPMSENDFVI